MMLDNVIYEYAIIRLVPSVEREEFLNIGVIVFSTRKKYLDLKYVIDKDKIDTFSKDIDTEMILQYLESWKYICEGRKEGGKIGELEMHLRFRWLVASRSTIIQSSKTHPGICIDPAMVLNDLYQRYVL